ncbi:MAG: DNA recombination protein RmuC, partial [Acidobacteria bacterium]|nr:DNA recombination protein RmuC [Acidobacteriota bacterium]
MVETSPYSPELFLVLLGGSLFVNLILLGVLLWRTSARSRGAAEQVLREELRAGRMESADAARELRQEVADGARLSGELLTMTLGEMGMLQKAQGDLMIQRLQGLTETYEARQERLRQTLESQLRRLEESNQQKLEEMRATVDEKLQRTLEKRLGESFQRVSESLEAVQRGLGEMQTLATGVGDLKRVLVNVKARGTWGEVQLGAILEQVLTPEQYRQNVRTKAGSSDHVEFAIRLPAREGAEIWLPIDSKFPQEDYLRLQAAADEG